eukprot:TRINITY_DN1711_c0_g1_i1.p1 TRINITY_DN1711_c0_g1~~TRINITY_DN1711_c0_g1_i1.p1  ORF type:complete len:158 (-),score=20.41 TRINITY_DN1711_c0_g1_i1:4-477(-)
MDHHLLPLKIKINEKFRTINIVQDITFEEMYNILYTMYGSHLSISYVDDELDKITVTSDEELQEAIHVATEQIGVLRLQLESKPDPPRTYQRKFTTEKDNSQERSGEATLTVDLIEELTQFCLAIAKETYIGCNQVSTNLLCLYSGLRAIVTEMVHD